MAELLVRDQESEIVVDLSDEGFAEAVRIELVKLGFDVAQDPFRRARLTISRNEHPAG